MYDLISVANMRLCDKNTIANKCTSLELMQKAGLGIYNSLKNWCKHTAIVSGKGNNGGDGYALACILNEAGYSCSVHTIESSASDDAIYYRDLALSKNIPITRFDENDPNLNKANIIVDCIFGTGFKGKAKGLAANAIDFINFSDAFVLSADINSGLNGDSGQAINAVKSDLTVSIGYLKNGMFLYRAGSFINELISVDIGIDLLKEENKIAESVEFDEILNKLPKKPIEIEERVILSDSELEFFDDLDESSDENTKRPKVSKDDTTLDIALSLSESLGIPIYVRGLSCDFVTVNKHGVFKKPDWLK